MKSKMDKMWKECHYFRKSVPISMDTYKIFKVKFNLDLEGSEHLRYHLYTRAGLYIRVLCDEVPKAAIHYITPQAEEKFCRQLRARSQLEYCRYLTCQIFHFVKKIHNIRMDCFQTEWEVGYANRMWLINCKIVDLKTNFSDMDNSRGNSAENENHKKLKEKLRREEEKQLQERTERIISTHYDTIKFATQIHNLNLPTNLDDQIKPRESCLDKIYGKERAKLKYIIKTDPFNTDRIKSFLDNIVFRKIPLLKKTFDDEIKKKLSKRRKGVKKLKLVKKINKGNTFTIKSLMGTTRHSYFSKIDSNPQKDKLKTSSVNLSKISDVLYRKTQRATFSKFLDCVRKGGVGGSLSKFYTQNSSMRNILDKESRRRGSRRKSLNVDADFGEQLRLGILKEKQREAMLLDYYNQSKTEGLTSNKSPNRTQSTQHLKHFSVASLKSHHDVKSNGSKSNINGSYKKKYFSQTLNHFSLPNLLKNQQLTKERNTLLKSQ